MTTAELPTFTQCGLRGIDRVPYGVHACHFYSNRDDLVATLVPYFVAGLRNNERCLWVAAPPLPAREAIRALRAAWPAVDDALASNALRILDHEHWYADSQGLKGLDVVQLWLQEEERALADGYAGLRITGNTSFLAPDEMRPFINYEHAITARFNGRRIITLCSYALAQCDEAQLGQVMQAHNCTFERPDADWKVVASL
jgi:hypothetical protein